MTDKPAIITVTCNKCAVNRTFKNMFIGEIKVNNMEWLKEHNAECGGKLKTTEKTHDEYIKQLERELSDAKN